MSNALFEKPLCWENRRWFLDLLSHKGKVRFAVFCAKQVIHLANTDTTQKAIDITELWLEDKATQKECRTAADAAYAYAVAAADAADAAADVASIKQEQVDYLRELIIMELPEDLKNNWLVMASI